MRLLLPLLLASALPAVASAQQRVRIHVEGNGGVYLPDIGGFGDQKTGWTAGVRASVERRGLELFAHYWWMHADEMGRSGVAPDFVITGVRQQLMVVGAETGLGRPLRIELAFGGVAQRSRVDRIEGDPDPSFYPDGRGGQRGDWSWSAAAVPGVSYRVVERVVIRVHDLLVLDDVLGRHNLAFTVGVRAF